MRFTEAMDDPAIDPNLDNLTTFFEVMATESQGMLDKRSSIRTLTEEVSRFSSMWRWKHGKGINRDILKAVKAVGESCIYRLTSSQLN